MTHPTALPHQQPAPGDDSQSGGPRRLVHVSADARADHLRAGLCGMIGPDQPAGAPLAEHVLLAKPRYHGSPHRRLQTFFPKMSLRVALSSIASANGFFSRRFSSSSPLSRLASATSIPPYLAFHLYSVASAMPCRLYSVASCDAVPTTDLRGFQPGLRLTHNPDELFLAEPAPLFIRPSVRLLLVTNSTTIREVFRGARQFVCAPRSSMRHELIPTCAYL